MNRSDLPAEVEEVLKAAICSFNESFSCAPEVAAFAPGRVNLIGEHTDYNDGFVLPMALPQVTVCVAMRTNDNMIIVKTMADQVEAPALTSFQAPASGHRLQAGSPSWANYIKGVIDTFPGKVGGFTMVINTSVPIGGGLSSSASVEVATFTLLEALYPPNDQISLKDKALCCQKAEHTFAGMPCGIMDQFISTMAAKNHALLIDCKSMEGKLVEMKLGDLAILIINSNVRHQLTGSEYPTRRKNCSDAAIALGVKSLRYATTEMLQGKQEAMDPLIYRRARHVIGEISRTEKAATHLINGEFKQFGELMIQSHNSLRDDFEVSCSELDQLVDIVTSVDGVLGSRMTGGGFGGCTVTLCGQSIISEVKQAVNSKYTGTASFIECTASDGAAKILL